MNIIPLDSKLPAYLKAFNISELNSELTAHASVGGYPVISIKGKVFAVVRDGERRVLPNPKDPDSAATSIEVVLVKVNKGTSKVFYAKGYDPKESEGAKPDCYSNEGVVPAADAANPQSTKCATCPQNQWGSRLGSDKGAKGKACSDSVRVAVAPAGMLNDPLLLRVPPASIRNLGEYGTMLSKRGMPYQCVVTKIGFDQDAESPKLTFKAIGYLSEEDFREVQELAESDLVNNILGNGHGAAAVDQAPVESPRVAAKTPVAKTKVVTDDEVAEAVAVAVNADAKVAAKVKEVTRPTKNVIVDDSDLDLDGIGFDD